MFSTRSLFSLFPLLLGAFLGYVYRDDVISYFSGVRAAERQLLIPGNAPIPSTKCIADDGSSYLVVNVGSNDYVFGRSNTKADVVVIAGKSLLSIERDGANIYVSSPFFAQGKRMLSNNGGQGIHSVANPRSKQESASELTVLDDHDKTLFQVRYVNKRYITVTGNFVRDGFPPISVQEDRVEVLGDVVSNRCRYMTGPLVQMFRANEVIVMGY